MDRWRRSRLDREAVAVRPSAGAPGLGNARRAWGVGVALALLTVAPRATMLAPIHGERYAMGTMFNVLVYHADATGAARAVDAALDEVVRLDGVLSHYKPDSDLSRLNREARAGFVAVDQALYDVLGRSLAFSRRSGGRFDVTIAPLVRAWQEASRAGRPPTNEEIDAARRCVGYQLVDVKPPNEVRFRSDCVALDLGGIGKGYAVDAAITLLKAAGIRHALVNGGGSTIAAIGAPPGRDGWAVDVGDRLSPRRVILLRDEAISTSQQYLRPWPFADGRFGEIIDPRRGGPLLRDTKVSVVTRGATAADALSTTLLLMPVDEGKQMLEDDLDVAVLWMSSSGELVDAFRPAHLRIVDLE